MAHGDTSKTAQYGNFCLLLFILLHFILFCIFNHPSLHPPSRNRIGHTCNQLMLCSGRNLKTGSYFLSWTSSYLCSTPTIRPPGFNLHHSTWSMLKNHFRAGQGLWAANLHKWRTASSNLCLCSDIQTMKPTLLLRGYAILKWRYSQNNNKFISQSAEVLLNLVHSSTRRQNYLQWQCWCIHTAATLRTCCELS